MLKGDAIVIVGSTGGFGREFANLCASEGKNLILIGRDEEKLREQAKALESKYGIKVKIGTVDLTSENCLEDIDTIIDESGMETDSLIYAAGVGGRDRKLSHEDLHNMDLINVTVPKELTERFVTRMCSEQKKGKVLITTGTAALVARDPGEEEEYVRTRKVMREHLRSKQKAYRSKGVTVTNFMPPLSRTEYQKKIGEDMLKLTLERPSDVAKVGYEAMKRGDSSIVATPNAVARFMWEVEGMFTGIRSARTYKHRESLRPKLERGRRKPFLRLVVGEITPEQEEKLIEALNEGSTISVIKEVIKIHIEKDETRKKEREATKSGMKKTAEVIPTKEDEEIFELDAQRIRDTRRIMEVYDGTTSDSRYENTELMKDVMERREFDKNGFNKFGQTRIEVRIIENIVMLARKKYQKEITFDELAPIVKEAFMEKDLEKIYLYLGNKEIFYSLKDIFGGRVETLKKKHAFKDVEVEYPKPLEGMDKDRYESFMRDAFALCLATEDGRSEISENDTKQVDKYTELLKEADILRRQEPKKKTEMGTTGDKKEIGEGEIEDIVVSRPRESILRTMLKFVEFVEDRLIGKDDRDER